MSKSDTSLPRIATLARIQFALEIPNLLICIFCTYLRIFEHSQSFELGRLILVK